MYGSDSMSWNQRDTFKPCSRGRHNFLHKNNKYMCSIRKLCDPIARMNIRLFFNELLVTSARYVATTKSWLRLVLSAGGNRRKQVIMKLRIWRQSQRTPKWIREASRSILSTAMGQCISVGAAHRDDWHQWRVQKKYKYLWSVSVFSGHWMWDPGHQNFEASVPKGHQNMDVFVGTCRWIHGYWSRVHSWDMNVPFINWYCRTGILLR